MGSEHPIVGSTVVETYIEKIECSNLHSSMLSLSNLESNYGVLLSNVELFYDSIKEFTMSDDPLQLLGPEVMVAQHQEESILYAFAYHDIYDKKVEQKVLHFFVYGFPGVNYLFNTWVCNP